MSGDEWKDSDVDAPTPAQVQHHITANSRLLLVLHSNDNRTLCEAFLTELSPCGEFVLVTQSSGFGLFSNWADRCDVRVMTVLKSRDKKTCKFEACV